MRERKKSNLLHCEMWSHTNPLPYIRLRKTCPLWTSFENSHFTENKELPSTCLPRNLPCLVFKSINTFLTYTSQTGQQQTSFFFRISTLLHILHIRLSFVIVHSIIIYSTMSKITLSPREIGTGGTGNIKSRQRGPSRLRLCFLHPDLNLTEWVTLPVHVSTHTPHLSFSPSHYFLSDIMDNTTSNSLLGY